MPGNLTVPTVTPHIWDGDTSYRYYSPQQPKTTPICAAMGHPTLELTPKSCRENDPEKPSEANDNKHITKRGFICNDAERKPG